MNDFPAYTLVDTETRRITSHFVQQEFQISVALPPLHAEDRPTSYPVLYLFDANFYFGGVTEVTRLMRVCNEFPVTIVIGIGYPFDGPVNEMIDMVSGWRMRDFTPVVNPKAEHAVLQASPTLQAVTSGGADAFYQFVTQEVTPMVEADYPIDSVNRTFMGHSWGGVFGLYSLFRDPLLYKNYLICSPDLPYADGIVFKYEEEYAQTHDSLSARLFISQGGQETAEHNKRLVSVLESRQFNDLSITHKSIMDCEHCASPIPSFVAGLKVLFG
jgi:predicted alpha/beta superfamily hydrolase